jgi:L-asparaginase II
MLAVSRAVGAEVMNYLDPSHPVQLHILDIIRKYSGVEEIPVGMDGCSAPTFYLSLKDMAVMFMRLARRDDEYLEQIFNVMTANPYMVAGSNQFDTDLMAAGNGRYVSKVGAEGLQCMGIRENGDKSMGIAIKVLDGNGRAVPPVSLHLMRLLGEGGEEKFREVELAYIQPPVINHVGKIVGQLEILPGGVGDD